MTLDAHVRDGGVKVCGRSLHTAELNAGSYTGVLSVLMAVICLSSPGTLAQTRGLVPLTEAQAARIEKALQFDSPNMVLTQAVREATRTIGPFLKIHSCLPGYDASSLNAYAAPGKLYPNNNYPSSPMPQMRRHDKSACLTVLRVHGWTMPAANTLRFEAVYVSESSGESGKSYHEVQKQENGDWLFSR